MKKVVIKDVGKLKELLTKIILNTVSPLLMEKTLDLCDSVFTEEEEPAWKPEIGEKFSVINENGFIKTARRIENDRSDYYKELLEIKNCFKTEEEAQNHLVWLKEQLKNKK